MARSKRTKRQVAFALASGVLTSSFLFACNGIIGLSDYTEGECRGVPKGGQCSDARADSPIGNDTGPLPDVIDNDVIRVDASGTGPVSWAHFKMPNFPQPNDAGPKDNIPTYAPGVVGGFVDSVSNLEWREPIPTTEKGEITYEAAQKICANAKTGNVNWRLPSRIELVTLMDLSRSPTIDAKFPTTEGSAYWTSSAFRPAPPQVWGGVGNRKHWVVEFGTGGLGQRDIDTQKAAVRCVKDK